MAIQVVGDRFRPATPAGDDNLQVAGFVTAEQPGQVVELAFAFRGKGGRGGEAWSAP